MSSTSQTRRTRTFMPTARISSNQKISVIIPTLNEAGSIHTALASTQCDVAVERIVVDGGSADRTAELARLEEARVVVSAPGRARQLNRGAREASGEVLLFLHADSRLPNGYQ